MSESIKVPAYVWCRVVKGKPEVQPDADVKAIKRPPRLTDVSEETLKAATPKLYVDFSTDGLYTAEEAQAWQKKYPAWFNQAESFHLIKVTTG